MQLRWENCTSQCPWDLLLLEFWKQTWWGSALAGNGHPSVFLCLLGILSAGRPSPAVGKPQSWGLSWDWAPVASLRGRHWVLALSCVICCENQPYFGTLLPCVLSAVLLHLGQVIPGIPCFISLLNVLPQTTVNFQSIQLRIFWGLRFRLLLCPLLKALVEPH